jgi:hypothetical protein
MPFFKPEIEPVNEISAKWLQGKLDSAKGKIQGLVQSYQNQKGITDRMKASGVSHPSLLGALKNQQENIRKAALNLGDRYNNTVLRAHLFKKDHPSQKEDDGMAPYKVGIHRGHSLQQTHHIPGYWDIMKGGRD